MGKEKETRRESDRMLGTHGGPRVPTWPRCLVRRGFVAHLISERALESDVAVSFFFVRPRHRFHVVEQPPLQSSLVVNFTFVAVRIIAHVE